MRPRRFYAPAPTPSHCVCLISADANDYKIAPGGVGAAAGLSLPDNATDVEYFWDFWQQIYWIRYNLADVNGTIQPHIRFQTDVNSTQAHLHTATDMGLTRVGFWVLKQPAYPNCKSPNALRLHKRLTKLLAADATHYRPLYDALYRWTEGAE